MRQTAFVDTVATRHPSFAVLFAAFWLVLLAAMFTASTLRAQGLELSLYGGVQEAHNSPVSGTDVVLGDFDFVAEWDGRSFDMPPHYGIRAIWWRDERWGFGVDFNHTKVYATDDTLTANGISRLEFTDGLNILTLNAMRRFPGVFKAPALASVQPYVGLGVGMAIPHVEFTTPGSRTYEYQVTGPAVAWIAGASMPFNDRWSGFAEYKGTRSWNEADLDGGGTLKANITTHALNFGVTRKF